MGAHKTQCESGANAGESWPPSGDLPYTENSLTPGVRYFSCVPLKATLSTAACAGNCGEMGRMVCNGCPVGARHARMHGVPAKPSRRAVLERSRDVVQGKRPRVDDLRGFCARCRRSAYGGNGLQRMRLIGGAICVSCYNREREVLKGRDAKGAWPAKWSAILRPMKLAMILPDRVELVGLPLVRDTTELMIRLSREHPGACFCHPADAGLISVRPVVEPTLPGCAAPVPAHADAAGSALAPG